MSDLRPALPGCLSQAGNPFPAPPVGGQPEQAPGGLSVGVEQPRGPGDKSSPRRAGFPRRAGGGLAGQESGLETQRAVRQAGPSEAVCPEDGPEGAHRCLPNTQPATRFLTY